MGISGFDCVDVVGSRIRPPRPYVGEELNRRALDWRRARGCLDLTDVALIDRGTILHLGPTTPARRSRIGSVDRTSTSVLYSSQRESNTMSVQTYRIFTENLGPLNRLIDKLNKRALRLSLAPISLIITGRETVDDDGFISDMLNIEIGGQTPKLNDWEFVGTIQFAGEAGNILRIMPTWGQDEAFMGPVVPAEYRTADPGNCDHCKKYRRRNDTYIVYNVVSDMFAQVGSSCLQDFVRSDKVGAMAALCEMMSLIHEAAEGFGSEHGERAEASIYIGTLLTWSAEAMLRTGWMSRTKAREQEKLATVDVALHAMELARKGIRCTSRCSFSCGQHFTPTQAAKDLADRVLAWAPDWIEHEFQRTPDSDYLWNLRVVFANDIVSLRATGIAASILSCYQRDQDYRAKQQAKTPSTSEYVGTVGEKLVAKLTLKALKSISTDYGMSTLHTFHDEAGNTVKWFKSGEAGLELEATETYEMSVKAHKEFNGCRETQVLRVKPFVNAADKKIKAKLKKEKKIAYEYAQTVADEAWNHQACGNTVSLDTQEEANRKYQAARDAANTAYKEWQEIS